MLKKGLLSLTLIALVVVAAFGSPQVASADEVTPTPTPTTTGLLQSYMDQALAAALGITVEELQALRDSGETLWAYVQSQGLSFEDLQALLSDVRETAIEAAVADGVLTPEQAEWILSRANGGPVYAGANAGYGQAGYGQGAMASLGDNVLQPYMDQALADVLGITVEELQALQDAGISLGLYAQSLGMSQEDLQALLTDVRETAIEAAVADGVLTPEQADHILSHATGAPMFMGGDAGQGQGLGQGMDHGHNPYVEPMTTPEPYPTWMAPSGHGHQGGGHGGHGGHH